MNAKEHAKHVARIKFRREVQKLADKLLPKKDLTKKNK